jgi:hypothetical protein
MTFIRHGFISSGFLNLSVNASYKEALDNNAIIHDIHEMKFTGYKNFDFLKVVHMPNNILTENYKILPANVTIINKTPEVP